MEDLGLVAWPPEPIRTERLVLREPEARDRAAFIELLASPEVNTYLGGPRPRDELERETPEVPERWPGSFVVDLDGAMIGQILLRKVKRKVVSRTWKCPMAPWDIGGGPGISIGSIVALDGGATYQVVKLEFTQRGPTKAGVTPILTSITGEKVQEPHF